MIGSLVVAPFERMCWAQFIINNPVALLRMVGLLSHNAAATQALRSRVFALPNLGFSAVFASTDDSDGLQHAESGSFRTIAKTNRKDALFGDPMQNPKRSPGYRRALVPCAEAWLYDRLPLPTRNASCDTG
jgi:hypothetical protein